MFQFDDVIMVNLILNMCAEIIFQKVLLHLPGANQSSQLVRSKLRVESSASPQILLITGKSRENFGTI